MDKNASKIVSLVGKCSYNETNKAAFKSAALALLRSVAKHMGLVKGTFDIRYNAAGIACSGDATLHAETVYIDFNADMNLGVLVRTCEGRKDYRGGRNQWYSFRKLEEEGAEGLAKFAKLISMETVKS